MSVARAVGRNTVFTAISRVLVLGVWFAITPGVLAALGPDRFGFWSLMLVLAGSLAVLDLGLGVAVSRFVAELAGSGGQAEVPSLLLRALGLQLALALVLVIPAWLLRDFALGLVHVPAAWLDEARFALAITLFGFTAGMSANLLTGALQGLQRMDLAAWAALPSAAFLWLSIHVALGQSRPLVALALAQLFSAIFLGLMLAGALALALRQARRRGEAPASAAPHPPIRLRRLLRLGSWLQGASILALAQTHLDKLLLGGLIALAPVGEYEIAWRAVYVAFLPAIFFLSALLPAAARHEATEGPAVRVALYRRALPPYLLLVFVIAGGIVALAGSMLEAWLGRPPEDSVLMLRAIALAQCATFLTGIASTTARVAERADLEVVQYAAPSLVLHLVFSYAGFRLAGLNGILLGFVVSSLLSALWFIAAIDRWLGEFPMAGTARAALPALVTVVPAGIAACCVLRFVLPAGSGRGHGALGLLLGGGTFLLVTAGLLGAFFPVTWRELSARATALTRA